MEKLELAVRNFSGLKEAQVPITRVTVLTGLPGSGKTAILRALALTMGPEGHGAEQGRDVLARPVFSLVTPGGLADEEPHALLEWVHRRRDEAPFLRVTVWRPRSLLRDHHQEAQIELRGWPEDTPRGVAFIDEPPETLLGLWVPEDKGARPRILGREARLAGALEQFRAITGVEVEALYPAGRPLDLWVRVAGRVQQFKSLSPRTRWLMAVLVAMSLMDAGMLLLEHPEHYVHPAHMGRFLEVLEGWLARHPDVKVAVTTLSEGLIQALYELFKEKGVLNQLSAVLLMRDVVDEEFRAEVFDSEGIEMFYELDRAAPPEVRSLTPSITCFWTSPRIPRPRGIPEGALKRLKEISEGTTL